MTCMTEKCKLIHSCAEVEEPNWHINGERLQTCDGATYLGITATPDRTGTKANIKKIKAGMGALNTIKSKGLHNFKVNAITILKIWSRFIMPRVTYGIHLIPMDRKMEMAWLKLEMVLMIVALGCFEEQNSNGLCRISELLILYQLSARRINSFKCRIDKREEGLGADISVNPDPGKLLTTAVWLNIPSDCTRKEIKKMSEHDETPKKRKLPDTNLARYATALVIQNLQAKIVK